MLVTFRYRLTYALNNNKKESFINVSKNFENG